MSKQGEERRKLLIKKAEEKIEQINTGYAFHVDAECITILRELMFELKIASFESKSFQKRLVEKRLEVSNKESKISILKYENKKLLKTLQEAEEDERKNKKR
jgi:hypothetical protein